jgi:hypothetical protein
VIACTKRKIHEGTAVNIISLQSIFQDVHVVIYGPIDAPRDEIRNSLNTFTNESLIFIDEVFTHHKRTVRLEYCRNVLLSYLHEVKDQQSKVTQQSKQDALVLMMDTDNMNSYPFNVTTIHHILRHSDAWDVLSFNRPHFYDIWALR